MASEKFKIVKGTKLPPAKSPSGMYPFASMAKGDAFFFDAETKHRVANASCIFGKKHGLKFRVCKAPQGGYGCWRVK